MSLRKQNFSVISSLYSDFYCIFASLFECFVYMMKKLLKEYWLSVIVLSFMAVVITCSTRGSILSARSDSETTLAQIDNAELTEGNTISTLNSEIDIPALLTNVPEQILYRKGYIVSYNKETKIPNWVAWHLTAEHVSGTSKRPGTAFHEDFDVPEPRANNSDYKGSGWSRGHMCPAGDCKWDSDAMFESFLFSNICPQNANLNSGVWNQIEISCRKWAEKYGDIYIVSGPILFNQEHETIGLTQVTVPEAFFKVILCLNGESKGIGFICRNTDGNRRKDLYVNSISQIERVTKMKFFPHLNTEIAEKVKEKANINDW